MELRLNEALFDALKRNEKPFDGVALVVKEPLPFRDTKDALLTMAAFVLCMWPQEPLLWLEDWHEHDSYRTCEKEFKIGRIETWLASPEILVNHLPGDDDVRIAIYSESRDFLWRFGSDGSITYIDGRWHLGTYWNGTEWLPRTRPEWYVDFTAAPHVVDQLMAELGPLGARFEQHPAQAYFEARAAP